MPKAKSKATVMTADGSGGLAKLQDRRFEQGDWPIRFEVPNEQAGTWLRYFNAECERRGWAVLVSGSDASALARGVSAGGGTVFSLSAFCGGAILRISRCGGGASGVSIALRWLRRWICIRSTCPGSM